MVKIRERCRRGTYDRAEPAAPIGAFPPSERGIAPTQESPATTNRKGVAT